MTRFTNQSAIEGGKKSGNINLMTTSATDHGAMSSAISGSRNDAVKLLQRASALMSQKSLSSDVQRYAKRYFLTDGKSISEGDRLLIKTILIKTLTGLTGDVAVKVGPDAKAYGFVSVKGGDSSKSYHNQMVFADGDNGRVGAIHIDSDTLETEKRLGVVTLIHEATHKYAGTMDYCYFDNNSRDPDGEFTQKQYALVNADSYAWFVLKVGRSRLSRFSNPMFS